MAAVRSSSSTPGLPLPNFTTTAPIPRRMPLTLICSISTPTPRKLTTRKNYLRQKLLKTLSKPYPNSPVLELTQTNPVIPIQLEQEQVLMERFSEPEHLEIEEFREAENQESVKVLEDDVGKVSKNFIFKYGLWLVGGFLLQTICAVWFLGSAKFEDENGNVLNKEDKNGVLEVDVNGKCKSRVEFLRNGRIGLENGGYIYVDEDEMEEKIEEIRVMAREARARERLERKKNGFVSEDSDKEGEDEFGKSGIEKEVSDRLVKVGKRYEYARRTVPVGSVDYVKKNGVGEKNSLEGLESMDHVKKDGMSEKESLGGKEGGVEALMFKKKYKFRDLSGKPSDKPKGFTGVDDHKEVASSKGGGSEVLMNGDIGGGGVDLLDDERELGRGGDARAGMSLHLEEDGQGRQALESSKSPRTAGKKFVKEEGGRKEVGFVNSKSKGLTQDRNQGKPPTEAMMSRKSNTLGKTSLSNEHDVLNKNNNLKSRGTENYQSAYDIEQKNSESETDCWWLSLPYVLAVLLRGKLYGDGVEEGLFTLRSSSHGTNNLSHTVAFEDRGDATNFCYLVQSFFEDLEDFSAEIVPLPVKELEEGVKSHALKVIVVKKGQLKLYAGQPLLDVEMTLRSLVGQS